MARFLSPLLRGTTYTRLLHLWVPMLVVSVWMFIDPRRPWVVALLVIPAGLVAVPLADMQPSHLVVAWSTSDTNPLIRSFARIGFSGTSGRLQG